MNLEIKKRILTSIFLLCLLILMYLYTFIMIISSIIIAVIAWIEFDALITKILLKKNNRNKVLKFLYKFISLLYLSSLVWLILITESHQQNLKIYLLYSVLTAISTDIGGLVFGKIFKGRKLTRISPNKTISGSLGSFIFSFSLIPFFFSVIGTHNLLTIFLITIIISLTSQLGDLFISYLKRKAKVKDTSDILPGHGGLLDRVDGIIFAIPIGILLFNNF
jgi:phosphatidate cytidylyltransferase